MVQAISPYFDVYLQVRMCRRKVLRSILAIACSSAVAVLLLGSSGWAAPVPAAQEGQAANQGGETVHYDSSGTSISAYLVKPNGEGKHAAVLVIHDAQGLTDGIRDLTRQFAAAGFVALAPDLLSRAGGSKTPQQSQAAIGQMAPNASVEDLRAGYAFLQKNPDVDPGKISSVGYGWGGWRSFTLAATVPTLYRAVIYSGPTPNDGLQDIHAPVMANYAQFDFRIAGNALYTEKQMKEKGKKFTYYVYPNTDRAFFNPANPRYDAGAAKLAWSRTLEFLR